MVLGSLAFVAGLVGLGCGGLGSLPRPPVTQVTAADYIPVPFAPRVPPVEFIPPSPSKKAVWVDGSWEWAGNRYGWRYGSWMIPPESARRARWTIVRRPEDGQLFFAPSSWKDSSGNTIDERSFVDALGPNARARSRVDGAPPVGPTEPRGGTNAGRRGGEPNSRGGSPVDTGPDTSDTGDED